MALTLPNAEQWVASCQADGEFALAACYWSGGLRLRIGERTLAFSVDNGQVTANNPGEGSSVLSYDAPIALWEKLLAPIPPKGHNDIVPMLKNGLTFSGDPIVSAQYYAATMRAIELLRAPGPAPTPMRDESGPTPRLDTVVGRYVHLDLDGHDYRIYFEEAGEGIPLLMQHTAGSHSSQFRHLFEMTEITKHFRLIAYDLPFHGKSLPPVTKSWWSEEYLLTGEFLRAIPLSLAAALKLDRPVFMGCSVGGLLALDLAFHHPDVFRAVISLEGALKINEGHIDNYPELCHPQVSNDYKGRSMDGLMAPASPIAYRKETAFVYSSGWPPAFRGDLYYYMTDYDLRQSAAQIDTKKVAVHILSGEYDYSGTPELGRSAHQAIEGSTWTLMTGMGHFPMSENPRLFAAYLLPVLKCIRGQ